MAKSSIESELERLLAGDPSELLRKQQERFERITGNLRDSVVLFGCGYLGKKVLAGLRYAGIEPHAFADNNPKLWDTTIDGLKVLSPESAVARYRKTAVFVAAVYTSAPLIRQMSSLGVKIVPFPLLAWSFPEALTPHGSVEPPHKIFAQSGAIRKALSTFGDDASRREYVAQLTWRTQLNSDILPPHLPPDQIYFPDDLVSMNPEEIFVDCGAFNGDSIRVFIDRREKAFRQVIGIEPDPSNYNQLRSWFLTLPETVRTRLTAINLAVGLRRENVRFNATGTAGSSVGGGTYEVECAPLDEIIVEIKPTYIKMDIEGAEYDALIGTRQTIERCSPVLAICLYHCQEHLWQIPLLLRSMREDYQLFLRRYSDDCWELVCYAVPVHRIRRTEVSRSKP